MLVEAAARGAAEGGASQRGIAAAVASAIRTGTPETQQAECPPHQAGQALLALATKHGIGHTGDLRRWLRQHGFQELSGQVGRLSKLRTAASIASLVNAVEAALETNCAVEEPRCGKERTENVEIDEEPDSSRTAPLDGE